ncbi:hypothetical protein LPJ78_003275 [Coemansia sp. RSA 989]|nr:hypothetical protein BX667DRAFT_227405 [Coemansia mojavensis]KAJ1738137.1 hypothetical protein LPJ68_005795 [Coemansia sp. RSA 1086]KAJ1748705.1 hypothetical protein LPJ79_004296 [Coemansia sp. RSA 1821]KAJ1864620.1 hypothetical protein LPJ78_003275 [Coemansia sp. RSA 989]KAJ1872024.1 hypothetical protein LPJ55_003397 [Coemansia sp. RSA 990]KAJ2629184.1 hypothetical protein H4R22_003467 [Coemansia sp. RSA 1290]KAJ2647292.1 hypothetical protein IWW40_004767 [Coemansia sp. RSA 1250]KAJ26709
MSTVASNAPPENRQLDEHKSPGSVTSPGLRTHNKHTLRQLAEEQRQAMIENFDLEVEDKIRSMMVQLEADKAELALKADCEVAQLPKCVREMPLKTFLREYNGDVSAAVRGVLKLDETQDNLMSMPETPLAIRLRRKATSS